MMLLKRLKQFFCRHEVKLRFNPPGYRFRCTKCGKLLVFRSGE